MGIVTAPGLVEPHVLYRYDEICKRLGWSRKSWDAARSRGLNVLRSGKRAYVLGQDALEFIQRDSAAKSLAS